MESKIIYKNDLVTNIYAACSCCYNNNKVIDYLEKTKYIEKRINAGHDSILEHGRVVIEITGIVNTIEENYMKVKEACVTTSQPDDDDNIPF